MSDVSEKRRKAIAWAEEVVSYVDNDPRPIVKCHQETASTLVSMVQRQEGQIDVILSEFKACRRNHQFSAHIFLAEHDALWFAHCAGREYQDAHNFIIHFRIHVIRITSFDQLLAFFFDLLPGIDAVLLLVSIESHKQLKVCISICFDLLECFQMIIIKYDCRHFRSLDLVF